MKALVKYTGGNPTVGTFVWCFDIQCEYGQFDTYCQFEFPMPIVDSTTLGTFLSTMKDSAVAAVEAVSGPTLAHSDITVFGAPIVV